ncbi:hypothetical protein [Azospirillum argentinense]|uniref:Uncharacterized protein n=1 Tax=Azospirillum argentinense TaxID=2970906 RepID=A0A5B0KKS9_9PROT|nr:hypothetical protein [Azospirillum argentinense]KAA1052486.1 hypothetical protein FH063_004263 [Azospirillum argentinense]
MAIKHYIYATITGGMLGALVLAFFLGQKHDFILSVVAGGTAGAVLVTVWMLPMLVQYYVALFMKDLGRAMAERKQEAIGEPD